MTAPKQLWLERRRILPVARSAQSYIRLAHGVSLVVIDPPAPRWLRWLGSWYSSARRAGPLTLDTGIAMLAVWLVSSSPLDGLVAAAVFVGGSLASGLAKPRNTLEAQGVAWYCRPAAMTAAVMTGALVFMGIRPGPAIGAATAVAGAGFVLRSVAWQVIAAARRRGMALQKTLVIASTDWAGRIRHRISTFPEAGLSFVGAQPLPAPGDDPTRLEMAVERSGATHLVLAGADAQTIRRVAALAGERWDCSVVMPVRRGGGRARIGDVEVISAAMRPAWGSMGVKRFVDVTLSSVLLVVLSPVLLATALAIRLYDHGPAIFRQKRVGRDGCVFTCYKFRSMVVDAEQYRDILEPENITGGLLFKLKEDPRVTPVGHFIRRFSIDELPQLLNVLRGDMSLVGPRPLPVDPAEFSGDAHARHTVPPGLTGLWQVHGANALNYQDMLDLDFTYVTSRSLVMDLEIIARTAPALLVRRSPG